MAETLLDRLKARIAREGPISVADYMAACLGDPTFGYYMRRDPFGAHGDFTTAPEISQTFGELLGLWCAETWRQIGAPSPVNLVELGPGRGTLMADALRAVGKALPAFREALDPHLVETSPALRAIQKKTIGDATWHEDIAGLPEGPMLLLANEFFDALPIHQYVGDGRRERMIGLDGRNLAFTEDADDIVETCPAGQEIAAEIGRRLAAHGGAALIVDYGPAQSGPGDSLQAVKDHAYHPVLETPGEADLTAHVDFQALLAAARDAGAVGYGPISQRDLLRRLGIEARIQALVPKADPAQRAAIVSGYRRLTDADQMGTLFKAIALTGPDSPAPPAFDE